MTSAADLGLREAHDLLARGELCADDLWESCRARAQALRSLNAFTLIADEAVSLTSDGALAGVPFAVKDLIDVAGLPTRAGSAAIAVQATAFPIRWAKNLNAMSPCSPHHRCGARTGGRAKARADPQRAEPAS